VSRRVQGLRKAGVRPATSTPPSRGARTIPSERYKRWSDLDADLGYRPQRESREDHEDLPDPQGWVGLDEPRPRRARRRTRP